jgi:class 3 adenylate cyclase
MEPAGPIEARLAALEAQVAALAATVAELRSAPDGGPGVDDDDQAATWRRLGLVDGERRTVTVLFADVSGFTALSETLDPEAMQLVMRDTMSLLAECVQAEGGTLEKFIGDALCALFGAPVAHVDEPERAARAALAMHAALADRAGTRPDLPALTVHVGINTGPVIAGAVGDGSQFGVMGDTINTAARLMGLAGDAQTFVSATTARRLRRHFRLADAGRHEVKGKAEPIAVAELVGVLSPDEREDQHRLRSDLVGRDEELRELARLAAAARGGDGAVAIVLGEEGMGTSRVAAEVGRRLAGEGWLLLRASARVHAETPLGLVASALGPLADAAGADRSVVEALHGADVAAPHDFELALGDLVARASDDRPVVVVLDDVDSADPGSIEVVRYLSRVTADRAVLWLLTGVEAPPAFDPAIGTDDATVLRLAPLTEAAVVELLDRLLPGALDIGQRRRLAQLAEGNPQFAVEIAHALVDEGVVVEGDGEAWSLVGDPAALDVPGSVAELIEARIDELPTQARVALQDAAVIGQRFSEALLRRIATIPTGLDAALAELADAELVRPPEPAEGGDLWTFRSRLVRQVAYDSILRRRRPAAHRTVADALVALEPDHLEDNADLLAHHFEASDDPALAISHLVDAVERAEAAYNLTGTLDRAQRALRLCERFPGRADERVVADLLRRKGTVRLVLGDDEGLDDLEQAVEQLRRIGTATEVVAVRERAGWYLTLAGRPEAAEPYLRDAAAQAEADLDGGERASALAAVATSRAFAAAAGGDLAGGMAAVEGAAADARAGGDTFTEARASLVGGICRLWAGDAEASIGHLRASLDLSWAGGYSTLADRCGRWLVRALVEAGRAEEAVELAQPLLARSDDRGDPSVGCGVRAALALLAWRRGDLEEARALATEAVRVAEAGRVAPDAAEEARRVLSGVEAEIGGTVRP